MRRCSTGKRRGWRIPQKRCASSGRAFRRSSRFRPSQTKTNPLPTSAEPSTAARWGSAPVVFAIAMSILEVTKGATHMFVLGQSFVRTPLAVGPRVAVFREKFAAHRLHEVGVPLSACRKGALSLRCVTCVRRWQLPEKKSRRMGRTRWWCRCRRVPITVATRAAACRPRVASVNPSAAAWPPYR